MQNPITSVCEKTLSLIILCFFQTPMYSILNFQFWKINFLYFMEIKHQVSNTTE